MVIFANFRIFTMCLRSVEAGSTISLIEKLYRIATNHLSWMFLALSLVLTKSTETIQEQKQFEHLNRSYWSNYAQYVGYTRASTTPGPKMTKNKLTSLLLTNIRFATAINITHFSKTKPFTSNMFSVALHASKTTTVKSFTIAAFLKRT